jgi:hypothetical protein
VIPGVDFKTRVETAFGWLISKGFRLTTASYGPLGVQARLTNGRHWLKLTWEARDLGVFLSWGDVLAPGRFNTDPYRVSQPLQDLVPGFSTAELELVGAIGDEEPGDALGAALRRLSSLIREAAVLTAAPPKERQLQPWGRPTA